jgi:hypothetical protein
MVARRGGHRHDTRQSNGSCTIADRALLFIAWTTPSSSRACSTWPSWPWWRARTVTATTSCDGSAPPVSTTSATPPAGALTSYVVASDSGPHRKYYGITTAGQAQLKAQGEDWRDFSTTVSTLLETQGAPA